MNWTSKGLVAAQLTGTIIALVVALIGAVLVATLFLGAKRKNGYRGWMRKLSAHVNFDRFLISSILKFLYAFTAIYCIVYGIVTLFSGGVVTGLLWMVLGPIALRVVFEQMLLLLSLREEASETNDLLRRMQGLPPKNPIPPVQQPQPQQPAIQPNRPAQGDPRYPQRPASYTGAQNASYNGYGSANRQAPPTRPADYGMTQRYAPIRNSGYNPGGYDAAPGPATPPPVRPTPADGTGRFSALPKRDDPDART